MRSVNLQPDTLLHIYYLEGRISEEEKIVNENYIGTWEEDGFSFMFFIQPADEIVALLTSAQASLKLLDTYQMSYEQWQGGKIEPRQIGSFLLSPPWFTPPAEEPSTVITLDPGLVFGNGLHPTTQDCLQALEIACAGQKVNSMLDLGCGTGILALAAVYRGCRRVIAIDFNLLAAQTARHNVTLNGFEDNIVVINGQAESFTSVPTDLLIANIHYDVMKDIIASEGFLQQKWFILSGILPSEAQKVETALHNLPVLILQKWCRDATWHTFLGITQE